MQAYRIAYWRVAAEEINYRRFFNINELAGLRMELPELFEETHRLVFSLIEAAMSRACGSITSTGFSTRAVIVRGCSSILRHRSTFWSRRYWHATKFCRLGRLPAVPGTTLSIRCYRSSSIRRGKLR